MLTPQHCDLFRQPFFQFSQLKQYCPERIEPLKAEYKTAWQDWRSTVFQAANQLNHQNNQKFVPPHIERWCNGWQVRAHFFAYLKYVDYDNSAAILSLILNRKRLTVSLEWHAYRAHRSVYSLADYHQWLDLLNQNQFGDFEIWQGNDNEYADYPQIAHLNPNNLILKDKQDFFCIGKHLTREQLANTHSFDFMVKTLTDLLPLYEAAHFQAASQYTTKTVHDKK